MENLIKFNSELLNNLSGLEKIKYDYKPDNDLSIHLELKIQELINNHVNSAISILLSLNDHLEEINKLTYGNQVRMYLESIE